MGICGGFVYRVRSPHRQGLFSGHGLPRQMPQGELDRLGLGSQAVAVHDRLEVGVLDLDIRPHPAHTPIVHLTCTLGVRRSGTAPCAREERARKAPMTRWT